MGTVPLSRRALAVVAATLSTLVIGTSLLIGLAGTAGARRHEPRIQCQRAGSDCDAHGDSCVPAGRHPGLGRYLLGQRLHLRGRVGTQRQ